MKFSHLFSKQPSVPVSDAELGLVYQSSYVTDNKDIERVFTRLFSTEDGQKVLAHLQVMTFQRALGPGSSDEQLRYTEGQRALMAAILRLIDRGRHG